MFPGADLDRVANDDDLDLTAFVHRVGVIVFPGEAHVPGRINLASHRRQRHRRPWRLGRGADLGGAPLTVGFNSQTAVELLNVLRRMI